MDSDHTAPTERLWTPWRLRYISGGAREDGCIFCNRLASDHDTGSLILHRGAHTFTIMNLYPYNTGHIMLVPNEHAADPAELPSETLCELGETLPMLTTTLRRVYDCDGFNVGLNIGSVAGAGVAAHLHQHIVPRWQGDANFMPILASTMVIPETIPVTYAKIRSEIERIMTDATIAYGVLLDPSGHLVLTYQDRIPSVPLAPGTPAWKSILESIPAGMNNLEVAGWGGAESARNPGSVPVTLTLHGTAHESLPDGWKMTRIEDGEFDAQTEAFVLRAQAQRAPTI